MLPHLGEGREVDLQQHRDDHQPDEDRDRQFYLRDLGRADRVEDRREEMAEGDADNDAEGDPEGQVALEGRQGAYSGRAGGRSEEHTSELQSLMRISYAVFCLKKKN